MEKVNTNELQEDTCYYPDSKKWFVGSPERTLIRSDCLDYYEGEE